MTDDEKAKKERERKRERKRKGERERKEGGEEKGRGERVCHSVGCESEEKRDITKWRRKTGGGEGKSANTSQSDESTMDRQREGVWDADHS